MTDEVVTADLSKFGYRELSLASEVLEAYSTQGADFLGDSITLNFNTHSGYVFLPDEDYRVGMVDPDGYLREWFFCPYCGIEGFDGDSTYGPHDEENFSFEQNEGYCSERCRRAAGE